MQEEFEKAAEDAKTLPDGTSNDDKLKLYGLYKQGTVGDVNTGKPGIFDQKGRQPDRVTHLMRRPREGIAKLWTCFATYLERS